MIGGLVLAAGGGTRFAGAEPKLLAMLRGRPVLQHAIDAATAVDELERVVVVLGAEAERVRAGIEFGRAEAVVCRQWADGLSASLRVGVGALRGADRVIVMLGDAPDVTPELVRRFVRAPEGARAVYGGRPGHPVVLGRSQLDRLAETGGDSGARGLLAGGAEIECGDLASGRDIDTIDDLEEMRDAARAVI